ncbi:MAG: tandem-95 repeat protein [Candidatus Cloacimonetes bacterium]|nr:tandem-95 repeat protein [Candidatus Cloacimonadota bacterium]
MYKQKILLFAFALVLTCLMFADPPIWTPMTGNQYNMQVYAEVSLYEQEFNRDNPENILAAFGPGGVSDCRAIAVWDQVGPYAMWYLTVRSNAESSAQEIISFMIYDADTDLVYECEGDSLVYFADNSAAGSLYEPYQLYAPADLPPVSQPDDYTVSEDMLLSIDAENGVLANDFDPDGLNLTALLITDAVHGVLLFNSDGAFTYQPDTNFFGVDYFSYQASDGVLNGEETLVTITVEPVNDPPVFLFPPLGFNFDEDQDLIEYFSNYISDPEGDMIDVLSAYQTEDVIIEIAGLVVQFSAPANWYGSETVTFEATDVFGASSTQEVLVTVNSVNDAPVIDIPFTQYFMTEDNPETLDLAQYISDIDNLELTLTVTDNDNISVEIDGFSVTLIPDDNWFGSEVLNFVISDEMSRLTDNDFVEIVIEPENDAPVINIPQDEYHFNEDENLMLDLTDFISDVDDSELNIYFSGNIELNFFTIAPAVFNITAPQNWFGSELITFTVMDTSGLSDSDDVTINVISVPDAPVIQLPDYFELDEDTSITVDFEAEGYVYDVDSEILNLAAEGINVQVNITGLVVEFVPLPDWNGSEMITFTVYDETQMSDDEVEIIVYPLNDPPVMDIEDSYTLHEDQSLQVDFAPYIFDIDLDTITLSVSGNQNVIVDIDQLMVTFSALENWFGSEILVFSADDNQGRAIVSDTTEVFVLPANDPPVIELPPVISFNEDQILTRDFNQYITDDSDSLFLSVAGNENIDVSIEGLMVTFTPDYNWNGFEVMTFYVSDGEFIAEDNVNVSVIPINDPPQINLPLEFVFNPNQSYNVNFINYVFDLDGDPLSLSYSGNVNVGVVINGLQVTFTTNEWLGVERITFTVDDGQDTSDDAVDIIVTDDTTMPVIYLPASFSFNEDSSINVDFNQYIYNDSNIQVYLSAEGNQNVIVQIDSLTNQVALSAAANWFGSETITFTIYAPGYDYYNSDSTVVIVNSVNDAPVINLPYEGFSFLEDASLMVNFNLGNGYISDIDSDSLFISLNANAPVPNINAVFINGIATFTAPQNWNGTEQFTISVNDGAIFVEEVFNVTVIPVNDTPSINLPDEGFSFPENSDLAIDFSQFIFDIDFDILTINLVNETDYIFPQIAGTMVNLSALPNWNGYEALVFSVNDMVGRAIDIDTVMVYVTPVNTPPYVQNPLPDLEIMENSSDSSINLNNVFADYDTDPELNLTVTDFLVYSFLEPGENNFNISILNGVVTIMPAQNWFGEKTVFFYATDNGGLTAVDSTLITVISVNYPPVVIQDIPDFNKLEDFADFSFDLNEYFYDQDGDPLQYTAQYDSAQVIAQIDDSILTISSLLNWYGQAGIIIIANDPESQTVSQGFVVNVTPVNDPPQLLLPPEFLLQEDVEFISDFSNYASDYDNDVIIILNDDTQFLNISYGVTDPLEVHIIGDENWFGAEMVTFYVSDQTGRLLDSDSVLVNVAAVNDPPQINLPVGGFSFLEDMQGVVDFTPYISDIDSEDLIIIVSEGDNVQIIVNEYQVTFIPNLNWFGSEPHEFTVADGQYYASEDAQVSFTPVNDPPVLEFPDAFNAVEDTALVVDFTEYITLIDNVIDDITITSVGTYPNVGINITGTQVTFTPVPNFNGTVNISFQINDNAGGIDSDNVNLIVAAVNDAPTIDLPDSFSFGEDLSLVVDFGQYINDVDGDNLMLSSQNAVNINITYNQYMVTFTAGANWNGNEDITFYVSDQITRATDDDEVNVIVTPINDAPVINLPVQFRFNEDNTHERDFSSYISDIDTPLEDLSLMVSGNTNIIADIIDLEVTFSAIANWFGTENLTFTVYEDGARLQDSDDVLVIVNSVNDAPTINLPVSVNVNEGDSLLLDFTNYVNDVDNDYSDLYITSEGSDHLIVETDGLNVTILAETDWTGYEFVEFTVHDLLLSNIDNMRVVINPVNDPPLITLPDQFLLVEDEVSSFNLAQYITDVDNDPLTLTVTGNQNIQVYIQGLSVIMAGYMNWNGEEVIYFTVDDNATRLTATDSVLIVVQPVNDPPFINLPPSIIGLENSQETFDLSSYIYDVDGDSLTLYVDGNDLINDFIVDGLTITIVDDSWNVNENVAFHVTDGIIVSSDIVNITLIPEEGFPDIGDVVITLPFLDGLEPGEEFLVPVNVNILLENWEIYGFEFWLNFDPTVLEFLGFNFEGTLGDTTRVVAGERSIYIEHDFTNPLFGIGSLINIEFKYVSTEYEQDVVELDEFEFHSPGGNFFPAVFSGTVNNDFPSLNDSLIMLDQTLEEDFPIQSFNLNSYFIDNTPQSNLEYSISSSSQNFAVAISDSIMNIISIPNSYTMQVSPVIIVCYDRYLYSVRDTFLVEVYPVNDAPVISIFNDFQIVGDNQLEVDFNDFITDVDNNVVTEVTINIENTTDISDPDIQLIPFTFLPDLKTATFSGLPDWTGTNNFEITAYDPSDSTMQVFNVSIVYLGSDDIHCYPNPMNTVTGTNFVINTITPLADISIDIYDFAGRKVCSKDFQGRGVNEINWMGYTKGWNGSTAGTKLARGVYFAHITGKDDVGAKALEKIVKLAIKE